MHCFGSIIFTHGTHFNIQLRGGNRKGQLGDGQLTSSCVPKVIPQLRHRPVVAIACGENHSMVLTIGGSVYTWGGTRKNFLVCNIHETRMSLISLHYEYNPVIP